MWLPTLVSTLFVAEAIWRFVDEGSGVEQRASAIFNGVNTVIFALLGFACVSWPLISAKFQGQKDEKNVESEEKAKDEVVIVVERQDSLSVLKAAMSGGRRDDDKKVEVPSSPPADAPASPAPADAPELPALPPAPAPAPKRQVTYLTNLKTFLTFIVVAHHTVNIFTAEAGNIETNAIYGTTAADLSIITFYFG